MMQNTDRWNRKGTETLRLILWGLIILMVIGLFLLFNDPKTTRVFFGNFGPLLLLSFSIFILIIIQYYYHNINGTTFLRGFENPGNIYLFDKIERLLYSKKIDFKIRLIGGRWKSIVLSRTKIRIDILPGEYSTNKNYFRVSRITQKNLVDADIIIGYLNYILEYEIGKDNPTK
jgi:hypothetical protein